MKKYRIVLFLPVLIILAFVNANNLSIQKTASTSSVISKSNTCFNSNFSYANAEIERCNIYSQVVSPTYPGFQKTPGYLAGSTKGLVISSLSSSSTVYPGIELFDNNYLSHNYPSHNFW